MRSYGSVQSSRVCYHCHDRSLTCRQLSTETARTTSLRLAELQIFCLMARRQKMECQGGQSIIYVCIVTHACRSSSGHEHAVRMIWRPTGRQLEILFGHAYAKAVHGARRSGILDDVGFEIVRFVVVCRGWKI